ncbi:hypothetical protein INR49_012316 [Caranx melampygus]|nr:hypothetical protein INR49_012316 [Caranx melampygus]
MAMLQTDTTTGRQRRILRSLNIQIRSGFGGSGPQLYSDPENLLDFTDKSATRLHITTEGAVQHHSPCSKVALVHPEPVFSPESLPLHDVPQLTQVGLGNDIIRFELQRTQRMEVDGSRIEGTGKGTNATTGKDGD